MTQYATSKLGMPIYTFPIKIAERVQMRNGFKILAPINSWYFPIRIGRIFSGPKIRSLSFLLDGISKVYAYLWLQGNERGLELLRINEFTSDFGVSGGHLYIERTAKYLNWRFINHPAKKYYCYGFRDREGIIGYCVYAIDGSVAELYDFISIKNQRKCLGKIIRHLHKEKIVTHIVFKCAGISLRKCGFIKIKSGVNVISYNLESKGAFFTLGDSDWD